MPADSTDFLKGSHQRHPTLTTPRRSDDWWNWAADIGVVAVFAVVVDVLSLATTITEELMVNTVAFGRYLQPLVVLASRPGASLDSLL